MVEPMSEPDRRPLDVSVLSEMALGGEPVTVEFDLVCAVPGTCLFVDLDDDALDSYFDGDAFVCDIEAPPPIPLALPTFAEDADTGPIGHTIVGLPEWRRPARRTTGRPA